MSPVRPGAPSRVLTAGAPTTAVEPVAGALATFTAAWLRLRQPHDDAARATAAVALGNGWISSLHEQVRRRGSGPRQPPLRVTDLGCGTGATLRQLAPLIGGRQHWRVFDRDEALLAAWPEALARWTAGAHAGTRVRSESGDGALRVEGKGFEATVERCRLDLTCELDSVPWAESDLVTATALIDLASPQWLGEVIERAMQARAGLAFGLAVDGRIEWDPPLEGDESVARAFAAHQQRDKGFGAPALGPQASRWARARLDSGGYTVAQARSDWQLGPGNAGAAGEGSATMQRALIEGIATAAREQAPRQTPAIERWRAARLAAVGRSRLLVGHLDLVAVPRRTAG